MRVCDSRVRVFVFSYVLRLVMRYACVGMRCAPRRRAAFIHRCDCPQKARATTRLEQEDAQVLKTGWQQRDVVHAAFHNVTYPGAAALLKEKPVYAFVVRCVLRGAVCAQCLRW